MSGIENNVVAKFAGAAQQLTGALIVNPNDKLEVA
jgi:trehalose-6-phosphate synthase